MSEDQQDPRVDILAEAVREVDGAGYLSTSEIEEKARDTAERLDAARTASPAPEHAAPGLQQRVWWSADEDRLIVEHPEDEGTYVAVSGKDGAYRSDLPVDAVALAALPTPVAPDREEADELHDGRRWTAAFATVHADFGDEGVRTWWLHSASPDVMANDMRVEASVPDTDLYGDGQPGSVKEWIAQVMGVPAVELIADYDANSPFRVRVLADRITGTTGEAGDE